MPSERRCPDCGERLDRMILQGSDAVGGIHLVSEEPTDGFLGSVRSDEVLTPVPTSVQSAGGRCSTRRSETPRGPGITRWIGDSLRRSGTLATGRADETVASPSAVPSDPRSRRPE